MLLLVLLAGAAWGQTAEQSQGPVTVQARGGEVPAVSGTLESIWDPRTQARWKADFETERQLLELHVSRELGSELEAVLHMTHEWRGGTGTPGVGVDLARHGWKVGASARTDGTGEVHFYAPVSAVWRAGLTADSSGAAGLSLEGARATVRVGVKAGSLQAALGTRVSGRGWFTLEGSAATVQAGYRYRVGELSVGARARRTWLEDEPVDSLETDLLYRW